MKQKLIEEYEVNPYTMFLLPYTYGSKVYSRIFELEDEFLSPFKPLDIIKKSCEYFSSSYEGRKAGTKQLLGMTHKLPIVIDPTNSIYFFPTTSPSRSECIWVSHGNIENYHRVAPKKTEVLFRNNQTFVFPISDSSFKNQLYRTDRLKWKLTQRISQTGRKSFYLVNKPKFLKTSESPDEYGKDCTFE